MSARVLVADDDPSILRSLARVLEKDGHDVVTVGDPEDAIEHLRTERFDLVFLDLRMPRITGVEVLERTREVRGDTPVLMMTAFGEADATIAAMKLGAFDFLLKPFDMARLRAAVDKALASRGKHADPTPAEQPIPTGILSVSPRMHEVYKLIGLVAASNVTVLVRGESGTGKELVANAIHHHSGRSARPFVAVNCAAIPDTLLESELFGHEAGAFTGAVGRRVGKLEQADGGTIFLDEIGDMTPPTQAKVLRVLQQQTFERLGGEKQIKVDVRIVAATNRNLDALLEAGQFREDLYYRLKVVTIHLPPLRERSEDIPLLAEHFVRTFNRVHKKAVRLDGLAVAALAAHGWPGNVREFEHCLQQAVLLNRTGVIHAADLPLSDSTRPRHNDAGADRLLEEIRRHVAATREQAWPTFLERVEAGLLRAALDHSRGNLSRAAAHLGISRPTLREKCARYGLRRGGDESEEDAPA